MFLRVCLKHGRVFEKKWGEGEPIQRPYRLIQGPWVRLWRLSTGDFLTTVWAPTCRRKAVSEMPLTFLQGSNGCDHSSQTERYCPCICSLKIYRPGPARRLSRSKCLLPYWKREFETHIGGRRELTLQVVLWPPQASHALTLNFFKYRLQGCIILSCHLVAPSNRLKKRSSGIIMALLTDPPAG